LPEESKIISSEPDKALNPLQLLKPSEGSKFWLQASQSSLSRVWGNTGDDIYEQLLKSNASQDFTQSEAW
jgi:hypothetical protein